MAGVIAHNKAIVSSANARVLVNLISVLLSLTPMNKVLTSHSDNSPQLAEAFGLAGVCWRSTACTYHGIHITFQE